MISKAVVTALASGHSWLDKGANLLIFGLPGDGKSNLNATLGHRERMARPIRRRSYSATAAGPTHHLGNVGLVWYLDLA